MKKNVSTLYRTLSPLFKRRPIISTTGITTMLTLVPFLSFAQPRTPTAISGINAYQISSNGSFLIGRATVDEFMGLPVTGTGITNVTNGSQLGYQVFLETVTGNAVSSQGWGIGFSEDGSRPMLLANGEAVYSDQFYGCVFRAISGDGSRIIGTDMLDPKEKPFYVEVSPPGTFNDKRTFSTPEEDFFNESPTRSTVTAINGDGSVLAGYVIAGNNMYTYPVVYTEEQGIWSYSLPSTTLFNPYRLNLPPMPSPVINPQTHLEDYMTVEKFNEFFEQELKAQKSEGPYPDPVDYMDETQRQRYTSDLKAYDNYAARRDEYLNTRDEIIVTSPNFIEARGMALSPNARFLAVTALSPKDDPSGFAGKNTIYVFDLFNGSYEEIPGFVSEPEEINSLTPLQITSDGVIIAAPFEETESNNSYIRMPGGSFMTVDSYLSSLGYGRWIRENAGGGLGRASITDDMETIACNFGNSYTYLFSTKSGENGSVVELTLNPESLYDVFTIDGRIVKRRVSPSDLGFLSPGIYIIGGKKLVVK